MTFKKFLTGFVSVLALVFLAGTAYASSHETLFGNASYVPGDGGALDRDVQLVSDATAAENFAGVEFEVPDGTTFADLDALSTDFLVESDDACAGGSPRFSVAADTNNDGTSDGNIFVYLGNEPNFDCASGVWISSGDQLTSGQTVDTSQLGGTFYHDYDDAVADFGTADVLGVSLVVDGYWNATATGGDNEQTVLVDNTTVDDTLYTYHLTQDEAKNQCKNGGWQSMTTEEGDSFRNQGDCVSYFASDGKSRNNPGRGGN